MKKWIILFCFVPFLALAQEAEIPTVDKVEPQLEIDFSASAGVIFGIDLDNMVTGFKNISDLELILTVFPESNVVNALNPDAIVGILEIEELVLQLEGEAQDDGTGLVTPFNTLQIGLTDISAQIMYQDLYLKIYGRPDLEIDFESLIYSAKAFVFDNTARYTKPVDASTLIGDIVFSDNFLAPIPTYNGGVELGYDVEDFLNISLGLASYTPWDDTDTFDGEVEENRGNDLAFKFLLGLGMIPDLSVDFAFNGLLTGDETVNPDFGLGLGAEYELALNDTMSLVPVFGLDMVIPTVADDDLTADVDESAPEFSIGAGVRLKWPGTYDDLAENALMPEHTVFSGLSLGLNYFVDNDSTTDNQIHLNISAWEDTEEGLIPALGFGVGLEKSNLQDLDNSAQALTLFGEYMIGDLLPYGGINFVGSTVGGVAQDSLVNLKLGLKISSILPNTDLTLEWASNELVNGVQDGISNNDDKAGEFTTTLEINF